MVRRRPCAVSNHEENGLSFETPREARLLGMRTEFVAKATQQEQRERKNA
jgi:hypothetical protein